MSRLAATLSLAALLAATSCSSQPSPKPMPNFCGYHLGMKLEEVPMEGVTATFILSSRDSHWIESVLKDQGYSDIVNSKRSRAHGTTPKKALTLEKRPEENSLPIRQPLRFKHAIPDVGEVDFRLKEIFYEGIYGTTQGDITRHEIELDRITIVGKSNAIPIKNYLPTSDRNGGIRINENEIARYTLNKSQPLLSFQDGKLNRIEYPISMFGADDIEVLRLQVEAELGLSFVKIVSGESWYYEARSPEQGYKILLDPTGMITERSGRIATLSIERIAKISDVKLDNRPLPEK
ncbi:MAG: hypothetical protein RL095_3723 [Verrucomicrobiota bacterium]|jgi:hypothetical protein